MNALHDLPCGNEKRKITTFGRVLHLSRRVALVEVGRAANVGGVSFRNRYSDRSARGP